jgi:hypothetical protein
MGWWTALQINSRWPLDGHNVGGLAFHGCGDFVTNGFDGAAHRVRIQMGIAMCRCGVGVPEKLSDDRQPERGTGPEGRKAVAQIVDAKTL